jgi:diguanylate cyclase
LKKVNRRRSRNGGGGSVRHLFAVYAVVSLVPVLLLGVVLLGVLNRMSDNRGISEGQAKADLLARTSIAPLLSGADLRSGLKPGERVALERSVTLAVRDRQVLRLRLRDLDGQVVFADDGSADGPDDEALDAAKGETVTELTRLNADDDNQRSLGPRVVEVYEPLTAAESGQRIGVLELYLPYAPIAAEISSGKRMVSITLSAGLLILWLCLLGVSLSMTRRLQRQSVDNAYLASHDPLTGMPNRARFTELAAIAVAASNSDRPVAIALIDLDRFKEVNDTLGHPNGDQLLTMLAERLKNHIRPGDTIARLGGDEFGVILAGVSGAKEAHRLLGGLRTVLREPLSIDGLPLAIEASIGFSLMPGDGSSADSMLQHADVAMYVAKGQHRGVVHYSPEHDQYDAATLSLVAQLGSAITQNQLVLHYQPKVDLQSGAVIAVEALVRWQHPSRGLLFPDTFLPAAEQTELIEDLTRWVLRRAVTTLPTLDATGQLAVAVNISARSLARPDFAQDILDVLTETLTDPRRVILEITETALMDDPTRAAWTLSELHRAGLRISIDDFGAGHTSLGYLATLPITELKIDKAFVSSMLADERNTAIVRSVIELGHSLGFTVTAEGVETPEALQRLSLLHCDTVQGYLLARPVGTAELPGRMAAATAVLHQNRVLAAGL